MYLIIYIYNLIMLKIREMKIIVEAGKDDKLMIKGTLSQKRVWHIRLSENIYLQKSVFFKNLTWTKLHARIHFCRKHDRFHKIVDHVAMTWWLACPTHAVGHGFASHTKDHNWNGTNCLPAWHALG